MCNYILDYVPCDLVLKRSCITGKLSSFYLTFKSCIFYRARVRKGSSMLCNVWNEYFIHKGTIIRIRARFAIYSSRVIKIILKWKRYLLKIFTSVRTFKWIRYFFDSYLFHKTTNSFKTRVLKRYNRGSSNFSTSLFPSLTVNCKPYPTHKNPNRSSSKSKP